MPVSALIVTPGPTANAYVTLAVADQYHLDRPAVGTTWASASVEQKTAAILWATILMDAAWEWNAFATDKDQSLLWPRTGMLKRNEWEYVDYNSIPIELQHATAEYARQLLTSDLAGNSDIETQGITGITAGPVSLQFKSSVVAKPVPDTVVTLIPASWGRPKARSLGTRVLQRA